MPLAMRQRAGGNDHLASEMDPDIGALPEAGAPALSGQSDPLGRGNAADFNVGRQSHTQQLGVVTVAPGLLFCPQFRVAGGLECAVERYFVVAGVVREHAEAVVEGKIVGLNEIATS